MPVRIAYRIKSLLAVLCLALCLKVQAQSAQYSFINLNTQNSNLSFNKSHCITQDAHGFIWVGTADGLNRYNGRSFRTFSREELGLSSAFITCLAADDKGNLYIGTDSGICRYDYLSDSFSPLNMTSEQGTVVSNKVSKLMFDKNGTLWFGVLHQGLFSYDGSKLSNYFFEPGSLPAGIRAFCIDTNGRIYLSLYFDDLYSYDSYSNSLQKMVSDDFFKGDDIIDICRNPLTGNLLVASNNHGLCSVDTKSHTVKQLMSNNDGMIIESMRLVSDTYVWLSTTNGAYGYDLSSAEITILRPQSNDRFSLSDNHIFETFLDNSGGLWLATYSKGVDYSSSAKSLFDRVYSTKDNISLDGSLMRSMSTDENGNIWIASENKGLFCYKTAQSELEYFDKAKLPNSLFGISLDHKGKLWIGSFEGMYSMDLQSLKTRLYSRIDKSSSFPDSKIYSICIRSNGDIYFGTTLGLFLYDKHKDQFESVKEFEGIFVVDMIEDHKGRLWIGSYADGILCINPDGQIDHYSKSEQGTHYISCNKFNSVYEDAQGRIWAASFGAGFFCLDQSRSENFTEYNRANTSGLASNVIYKILDDSQGNLWLSSNQGLIAFNPDKGGIIRNFTEADGLLDNEFNYHSATKLMDGRLAFGSINGLVVFQPSLLLSSPSSQKNIVFSDFSVNSQVIKPQANKSKSYLQKHINETSKIVLKARDNNFGITISAPQSETIGQAIACKLEGYDKNWRKSALYYRYSWQGVPAGRYRLIVQDSEKELEIIVQQLFWKSWIAVLLYIIICAVAGVLIIRNFYKKAQQKAEIEKQEYEQEREAESYKDKMSFFMNVIHEIKTPLTLIRTPLQNLISKKAFSEEASEDIDIISHNADYLNQLVRELLDFISLENHGYILEYKKLDLIEKIAFLCSNFGETARSKGIQLNFNHNQDQLLIKADDSGITKILNNIIHNAVKYAQSYINIDVCTEGTNAIVRISNDGPVIPDKLRNEIFKPFTKYSESNDDYSQSFGIGLPFARNLSELHGGQLILEPRKDCTSFVLSLPIKSEQVPDEGESEIVEQESQLPIVLIVEDNPDLLNYLKSKLSDDYRVLTTKTAEKALSIIKANAIDVIISDISLPGMSGVELSREIKQEFEYSHIPVIILSAITNPQTKVLCMENGVSQYIEKPFNLDFLRACIHSEINRKLSVHTAGQASEADTQIIIQGSDKDFLNRLDKIIKDNLSDPLLSNEQLANELFISKTTLIRKLKSLLGMTPNEYIRLVRLNIAAAMLAKKDCRVNEICYAVGFNTPSYFAKCFKKQFGVLPADYSKPQDNK